jgi:hypothetical protein
MRDSPVAHVARFALVGSVMWALQGCNSQGEGSIAIPPSIHSQVMVVHDRKAPGPPEARMKSRGTRVGLRPRPSSR